MLTLQPVHDGALDLGKMQLNIHRAKAFIDGLERFQRAQVDLVDSRALQDDMADIGIGRHPLCDFVFQKPRIGEIEALVDP